MSTEEPQLELDRNPTATAESQQFSNPDDIRRGLDHAHELALLDRKRGWVGKLTGSSESNVNVAFCVIVLASVLTILSLGLAAWHPEIFNEAWKFFGTVILTVSGYIFGVKSSDK